MAHPFLSPSTTAASPRGHSPQPRLAGPCCSLRARPLPHPAPAPSWEDLLGER